MTKNNIRIEDMQALIRGAGNQAPARVMPIVIDAIDGIAPIGAHVVRTFDEGRGLDTEGAFIGTMSGLTSKAPDDAPYLVAVYYLLDGGRIADAAKSERRAVAVERIQAAEKELAAAKKEYGLAVEAQQQGAHADE